jgi:hypothetical protein
MEIDTAGAHPMTAQEKYNQFVEQHGCRGLSCDKCHCAFNHDKKDGTFECIIVVLSEAANVKEAQ